MKYFFSVLFAITIVLFSQQSFAQSKITGEVIDQTEKTKLANATIMLLQAKDSILVDFARANAEGKFSINNPDTSDYLLLVSYPKFGEYFQDVKKGSGNLALGTLELQSAANLIEEVLVTGKIPVVIKGDTTEYDASSFVTEKNAKVEDLLKVLPGISVDATGKITAQGKTVEKVLVDGEEFFGDDPTLVTRNIRSDMVDKVQVYEKKSEESERTGVDDGTRIQTINVKLKEDAKKGVFGKLEGAGGVDDNSGYYFGKLGLNKFKGSQKIAGYLIGSNDGNISLNWDEEDKFGGGNSNMEMSDDGGMMFTWSGDEFSYWNGKGQPSSISTGISFMDAFKDKKHKINLNYKYGQIKNDINENNFNQSPTKTGILTSNTENFTNSDANRHRFNTRYDVTLDSLSTITFKLSGSRSKTERNLSVDGESYENDALISENTSTQNNISEAQNITYDAYYTRKFKKEGRSISLRFAGNNDKNEGNLFLNSELNDLVNNSNEIIDQYKNANSNSDNIRTSISYSEPLSKKWRASISYDYNLSRSHSINNAYNKDQSGRYSELDHDFSNDFNFNTIRNGGNFTIGYKTDKIETSLTNNVRLDDMSQKNNYMSTELSRDYFTYNPSLNFRYNITKSKSLRFNASRNNQLPSLFQIQPLRQNEDQLNQTLGNENLKPSQRNNVSLGYNTWDMLKGKYIYGNISFSQTTNPIQQNVTIKSGGRRELVYENMDKVSNSGNLWFGSGFNLIKKHKIQANIGANGSLNTYYNYQREVDTEDYQNIAYDENKNTSLNYGLDFSIDKNTTKNLDFNVQFNPGWSIIKTSLNPEQNSNGFTFGSNIGYRWYLPAKITFYGGLNYTYNAPTKVFAEKFERVLFKPGISKKFLKGENLIADFYVSDLFNQHKGFSRSQAQNTIRQQTYNTISRYFMLKLTWDFTSMKGGE